MGKSKVTASTIGDMKATHEAKNAKRRNLYQNSPTFRAACRKQTRLFKRQKLSQAREHNKCWKDRAIKTYAESIPPVEVRLPTGEERSMVLFTLAHCAMVWGEWGVISIRRWVVVGLVPEPVITIKGSRVHQRGYSLAEVLAVASVLREHQAVKRYLQQIDKPTIRAIFMRVSFARQKAKGYGKFANVVSDVAECAYERED